MNAAVSFADVRAKLALARRAPAERRRFRRLPVEMSGRMMDAAGQEHACRTADISPGDMRIHSLCEPAVGDRVVFYLDALGRLEGHVVRRIGEGEFAVRLNTSARKRERIAESLTWRINSLALALEGEESASRADPSLAALRLETGALIEGEIIDFSLIGMAVRAARRPPIGAWVRIGLVHGRVARYIDGGFAVDFETGAPYLD